MSKFHKSLVETDEKRKFSSALAKDANAQDSVGDNSRRAEQLWRLGTLFLVIAAVVLAGLALRMEYQLRQSTIRSQRQVIVLLERLKSQREQLQNLHRDLAGRPAAGEEQIREVQDELERLITMVEQSGERILSLDGDPGIPSVAGQLLGPQESDLIDEQTALEPGTGQ